MNLLFFYAGALDSGSNHAKLMEFHRLDREIADWERTKSYKELFHSLEFTVMNVRAKNILKQLNIL